ncbi:MAG: amidohydrolase [Planctomycetaceae bacterium]
MWRFGTRFIAGLILLGCGVAAAQDAELVLHNGRVVTVDDANPEAQAIAVVGGKIVEVGSNESVRKRIGPKTKVIDAEGKLVTPGFIEGHAHFVGVGQSRMILDLTKAKTWDDIIAQVEEAAANTAPGDWIIGRGWHQAKWKTPPEPNVHGYPVHTELSSVTPEHPVLLTHASGHMCFANAKAMELGNVTAKTKDPAGGEILHTEDGKPSGVFRETAQSLVRGNQQKSPAQEERDLKTAIELATEACLENGITSFQDAGSTFQTIDTFKALADSNELRVRLYVMIRDSNQRLASLLPSYKIIDAGKRHLTVRAIKRSIDGALGPHGAWLLGAYEDMPNSTGLNTASVPSVRRSAELASKHDFQVCVHAIGDRANRETLDIFESFLSKHPNGKNLRWRVEHAQHLHPEDIPRFSKMGVIASMQAVHCTSDAIFVPDRLGEVRSQQGAYVWRSLLDSGAVVTNGTDAPVEDINPMPSFYASVTRRLSDGSSFYPEQCMTREEALKSYTLSCAYAAFEEGDKGSLETGKLADIVVWSDDFMKCDEDNIRNVKAVHTIVGGRVLYSADEVKSKGNE